MRQKSHRLIALLTCLATVTTPCLLNLPAPLTVSQVLAQTQEDRKAEADRLLQQGRQQFDSDEFAAAKQSFQQALAIYTELSDARGILRTTIMSGATHASLGETERAIELFEQAIVMAQENRQINGKQ